MAREIGDYITDLVSQRGEPADWEAANRLVQDAIRQLGVDRHRLYGAGNIGAFGLQGIVIRAHDKLQRVKTMVWSGQTDTAESEEDSLGDLANYALYGILLGRTTADGQTWWDLPLATQH